MALVRTFLLEQFAQWGLPGAIRTDNGEPFGVPTRDVVPVLSLWLVAWGITPILNRPRRPQDNAQVERNQGTLSRWAELTTCRALDQLQTRLDQASTIQRDQYRVRKLGPATRRHVFPTLYTTSRPFQNDRFDATKAHAHLAQAIYPRKVSAYGTISLYGKSFQVGLPFKGQVILAKFDPASIGWFILDPAEKLLKTLPDPRFNAYNLFNLTVCQ
jgi:hypothetical protein